MQLAHSCASRLSGMAAPSHSSRSLPKSIPNVRRRESDAYISAREKTTRDRETDDSQLRYPLLSKINREQLIPTDTCKHLC